MEKATMMHQPQKRRHVPQRESADSSLRVSLLRSAVGWMDGCGGKNRETDEGRKKVLSLARRRAHADIQCWVVSCKVVILANILVLLYDVHQLTTHLKWRGTLNGREW